MKVIITNSFFKNFYKKHKKNFSLLDLAENLQKKEYRFINLHFPFLKVKQKINKVDFRTIVFIRNEKNAIIPIAIFLKKDKKWWENIIWDTHQDLLTKEYILNLEDIENWDFEVIE